MRPPFLWIKIAATLALALSLGACVTQYQPMGAAGGYSDLQLSPTSYQITVAGNGYTKPEYIQQMALYRAASLTKQSGFQRFAITSGGVGTHNQRMTIGTGSSTTNVYGNTAYTTYTPPQQVDVQKASGAIVIQMLNPGDPGFEGAIDATIIANQLRNNYEPPTTPPAPPA